MHSTSSSGLILTVLNGAEMKLGKLRDGNVSPTRHMWLAIGRKEKRSDQSIPIVAINTRGKWGPVITEIRENVMTKMAFLYCVMGRQLIPNLYSVIPKCSAI